MKKLALIINLVLILSACCFADTFTSSLKPASTHCSTIDLGTLACQWDNAWGDGALSWDTITDDVWSTTAGVGTGLVSLTDGTASWSSNSLSGFTSISGTTLTDTVLSINAGSITSAVNGTFSGTGTFGQIIDSGLTASLGVYTDASKQLTSTVPTSGVLGYWSRTGTVISTATAGDDITGTGTITGSILTDGTLSIASGSITSGVNATFSTLVTAGEFNTTSSVGSTGTLASIGIANASPDTNFAGLLEVTSDDSNKLTSNTNVTISAESHFDAATDYNGGFNAAIVGRNFISGVQDSTDTYAGIHGGTSSTATVNNSTDILSVLGLNFAAEQLESFTNSTGRGGEALLDVVGMQLTAQWSDTGKEISGSRVGATMDGIRTTVTMNGEYSAYTGGDTPVANPGEVKGACIVLVNSLAATSEVDVNAYGIHVTVPSSVADLGAGGALNTYAAIFGDPCAVVANSNALLIEADGTLEFLGTATVWADENIGAAFLSKPAANQPDEDNFLDEGGGDTGITTLAFAIGEKASGSLEMPHSYKNGSNFTFHVHWQGITVPAGGTDNVQWRLTYTLARIGATLDAATIVDSADTAIDAQYEFNRTDVTVIDGSTKGNNGGNVLIEDQFLFTLERVAATADDYAGDALVATIGIHYEQDTVGSRGIITK